jgi:fructose-specific phosphotransferase system component IIB
MSNTRLLSTLAVASVVLFAAQAQAQEIFGSKFTHQLTPAESCSVKKSHMCSWVMVEAQGNAGHETAPRDGTIDKIRLVACSAGSFVLQIERLDSKQAQAVSTGPVINYQGSKKNCRKSRHFTIEEFDVNVPVKQGDSLGAVATEVSFLYNASSGPSILFDPPLAEGDAARSSTSSSGFLMMQAELAP